MVSEFEHSQFVQPVFRKECIIFPDIEQRKGKTGYQIFKEWDIGLMDDISDVIINKLKSQDRGESVRK